MDKILRATTQNEGGEYENFEGTRSEVESWIEDRFELESISIWIADETGVIVGRKPFGQKAIAWGIQLEA